MLRTFLNVGGTFRGRPLADDTGAQRMLLSEVGAFQGLTST
jgi:hypothetical protein